MWASVSNAVRGVRVASRATTSSSGPSERIENDSRKEHTVCLRTLAPRSRPWQICAPAGYGAQVGRSLPSSCKGQAGSAGGRKRHRPCGFFVQGSPPVEFTLSAEQPGPQHRARLLRARDRSPCRGLGPEETIDRTLVGKLAELGFLAAALPAEHGGMGLDLRTYALIVEELGRADSNVRGIVSVSNGLYGKSVARWGSPEQRARLLLRWRPATSSAATRSRAGRGLGPWGSRDAGRSRRRRLAADSQEDLHHARILGGTCARVRAHRRPGRGGITCFVVPTDAPGFEARPESREARSACAGHGGALPRRRPRPRRGTARRPGRQLKYHDVGARPRTHLAGGRLRWDRRRAASTPGSPTRRTAAVRPSSPSFQLVQELLAEIAVETDAARLLIWRAAEPPTAASVTPSRRRWRSISRARSPSGPRTQRFRCTAATGTSTSSRGEVPARRGVATLYEGTSQIQKLLIGRALTGEGFRR